MTAENLLQLHREARNNLLARLTSIIEADSRIVAAWLYGSLGRGNSDDLSDLDVRLVIADEYLDAVKAGRFEQIKTPAEPILIFDMPFNAPEGGAAVLVLYAGPAGPVEIDWSWQGQSKAVIPVQTVLLFDRVGLPKTDLKPLTKAEPILTPAELAERLTERVNFFWSMSSITAKKVARRETWNALTLLNLVGGTLEEVKWRAGANPAPPAYNYEAWAETGFPVQPAEQLALLRKQHREMEALTPLITGKGGEIPTKAIRAIKQYFDFIEELVSQKINLK